MVAKKTPGDSQPENQQPDWQKQLAELEKRLEGKQNQRIADLATNLVGKLDQAESKMAEQVRAESAATEARLAELIKQGQTSLGASIVNATKEQVRASIPEIVAQLKAARPPRSGEATPAPSAKAEEGEEAPAAEGSASATAFARLLNTICGMVEGSSVADLANAYRTLKGQPAETQVASEVSTIIRAWSGGFGSGLKAKTGNLSPDTMVEGLIEQLGTGKKAESGS